MGRITIFALSSCPHCKRVKAFLTDKSWEYYEISLTSYPEKRSDMLALADRLTVPQVFFNTRHLGGAAEVAGAGLEPARRGSPRLSLTSYTSEGYTSCSSWLSPVLA